MLNIGKGILDEQVISSTDGDFLWNPPVVFGEGECRGSGGAIDGDLVTTGDGEDDIIGGSSA